MTKMLDEYINLKSRVETRMKIVDLVAAGDEDILSPEEKADLDYRKEQLKRLQQEVVDIEDMSSGVSIMDLGLNDFRMDLLEYNPELNLYSRDWPLRTFNYNYPPAKFIWDEDKRVGMAKNSLVSEGCIISGGSLSRCVLSPKVKINSFSTISNSILLENVNVGRHVHINRAIIDKNVIIPAYTEIGFNKEEDIKRGFYVSKEGITVVPKDAILD